MIIFGKNTILRMNLANRISAFAKLGEILMNPDLESFRSFVSEINQLRELLVNSQNFNPWFTPDNVKSALWAIGQSLNRNKIEKWINHYKFAKFEKTKRSTVAVVMAGNIPLVGFHDFISVLISGNNILIKLSSDDNKLLPLICKILIKIEPEFKTRIRFTEGILENFDAIIATGSNNTARYFEYYFEKYPHIIRKNRNSVAVINCRETNEQLHLLGTDIFKYFGLGCRNVAKIYVPKNFTVERFYENMQDFVDVINHSKYKNNYDYNKAIYLVNQTPHFDNGFLILKEDQGLSSPISVLYFERYEDFRYINQTIQNIKDQIQCVVSADEKIANRVAPGQTQIPQLWEYADNIDTIKFLLSI